MTNIITVAPLPSFSRHNSHPTLIIKGDTHNTQGQEAAAGSLAMNGTFMSKVFLMMVCRQRDRSGVLEVINSQKAKLSAIHLQLEMQGQVITHVIMFTNQKAMC